MKGDEATMARLMAQSQRGDAQAYRVLLEQCQAWLTGYFRRRLPPEQLPDMVQEVLVVLHNKRASWAADRPFLPWLAAIARYRWVDHLRVHYRRNEVSTEPEDVGSELDADAMMARISLSRLMQQLPSGQATVLQLVKIDGLSITEAAQRTGQSESLVKVNIHRACQKLRMIVEEA